MASYCCLVVSIFEVKSVTHTNKFVTKQQKLKERKRERGKNFNVNASIQRVYLTQT